MLGDESYFIKKAEKVGSNRPAFAFLFPRYSLGKCLAFESHLPLKRRKRWGPIVRPSHFFFLAIRSGNARRSNPTFIIKKRALRAHFLLWRKRWDSNPRAVARKRFSRAPRYDHFGTFPFLFLFSFSQFPKEFLYDFKAFFFHDACCNGDVGVGDG